MSQLRTVLAALALIALPGCNLIFGLDEPTLAGAGGDENTGAGSIGGAGEGGSGAAVAGGGGGGSSCPEACADDCFEGACDGQTAVELAPSSQSSCVRLKSGSVWCFGSNRYGALGRPPNDVGESCTTALAGGEAAPCSYDALRVTLPAKAQSIGVGYHAVCAVLETAEVWCWGANDRGLLGHVPDESDDICDGLACRTAPTKVEGLPPAASVVVNDTHACAVVEGGVWCWGLNHAGQLGNGDVVPSNVAAAIEPEMVTPPGPVDAAFANETVYKVSLSGDHTCAADSDKHVWCWGANTFGQVGPVDGACTGLCATPDPVETPNLILSNAIPLVTPRGSTCFIDAATSVVQCRGWNGWEFLNKSFEQEVHEEPQVVGGTEGAATVTAGDTHLCALKSSGEVVCWGTDFAGQLGDGAPDGAATECAYGIHCEGIPGVVAGVDASQVRAGNLITMAITKGGVVVGWGINQTALLGYEPGTGNDVDCAYYDATPNDVKCTGTPAVVAGLPD